MIIFIIILIILSIIIQDIPFINMYYYFKIKNLIGNRIHNSIINKKKILSRPLYEFDINTSHNTYLSGIQHLSLSSYNAYKNALNAGVRYIEIDISENYHGEPIVAHGNGTITSTTHLKLDKVLDTIKEYGLNTSDPLFIDLDLPISNNKELNKKIVNIFTDKFENKLLIPQNDIDIANMPMLILLNKVIVFCRYDDITLNKVFHNSPNCLNYSNTQSNVDNKPIHSFTRIYLNNSIKSIFSFNFDSNLYRFKYNHNAIALNFQTMDIYLYHNLLYFSDYGIIHKSERQENINRVLDKYKIDLLENIHT